MENVDSTPPPAPQETAPTDPNAAPSTQPTSVEGPEIWGMKPNTFAMILHLSPLSAFLTFGLGVFAPLVLWLVYKDKAEFVDRHGKNIVNWLINMFILSFVIGIVAGVIALIPIIGWIIAPLFSIPVGLLWLIFPIVGGIKANDGKEWNYPYLTVLKLIK